MDTVTSELECDGSTYGQQHNKLLKQLTFIEDSYLNLHCLELDFGTSEQQALFFDIHESDLPENCQISCCINNEVYKEADFVVITNKDTGINYQAYITLKRSDWKSDISLENFSAILITKLNKYGMVSKLEMIEEFGVYLSVSQLAAADMLIKQRIEKLSQIVVDIQKTILR